VIYPGKVEQKFGPEMTLITADDCAKRSGRRQAAPIIARPATLRAFERMIFLQGWFAPVFAATGARRESLEKKNPGATGSV
jgi:hypothetical protein